MRRRPVAVLVFALVCGALSAHLARGYLRSQVAAQPAAGRETTRVAVAARDLSAGSVLADDDLRVVDWPAELSPPGETAAVSELVGQELVFPVRANEPILPGKLAAAVGGLAGVIPQGMRAVSVKVDEVIAVGGFVVPGSHVDVLVTMPADSDRPGITRIALQDVRVVAAGQSFEASAAAEPQEATVITLLVTPAQSEVLTLASTEGRIQLALRNTLDDSRAVTAGALANAFDGRAVDPPAALRAPTPARSPARPRNQEPAVEIYHGGERSVSSF